MTVHRLRDLDRRGRVVALVIFLALLAPFVAAVCRSVSHDWTPSNDDALLALRVEEVLHGDWPLVGQPSTAAQYSDRAATPPRHPGSIQFYAFAPLVAVGGADIGMLLGPAIVNFLAVAATAWVIFRRAGPSVGLVAAPIIGLVAYAQGPYQLVDPLSSNLGAITLMALLAFVWAILDGDVKLLPAGAAAFAWVAQQHLAIMGLAAGVAAIAAAGIVWQLTMALRRRDHRRAREIGLWVGIAGGLSLLLWLPVIVDQLFDTHNVTQFVHYARDQQRETVGFKSAGYQVLHCFDVPPMLTRTGHRGNSLWRSLGMPGTVIAAGVFLVFVTVGVWSWIRDRRSRSRLVLTVLGLLAVVIYTGSNIPASLEADRINFYRWMFAVNVLVWVTFGWALLDVLAPRLRRMTERIPAMARVALPLAAVLAVTALAVVSGTPRADTDQLIFSVERRLGNEAVAAVDGHEKVLFVTSGGMGTIVVGPSIALHLVEAGHEISVLPQEEPAFGAKKITDGDYDAVMVVESWKGRPPEQPGRIVATFSVDELDSAAAQAARARMTAALERDPLVVNPKFEAWSDVDEATSKILIDAVVDQIREDPRSAVRSPMVTDMFTKDFLLSPTFDPSDLALARSPSPEPIWGDDSVRIRVLTPEEWRATYR